MMKQYRFTVIGTTIDGKEVECCNTDSPYYAYEMFIQITRKQNGYIIDNINNRTIIQITH